MKIIKLTNSELALIEALLHEHKGKLDGEANKTLNDALAKLNKAISGE